MDYLFLKDEIEVDASCVGPDLSILRRYSSESAPPSLYYIKGLKKYNHLVLDFQYTQNCGKRM